MEPAKPSIHFMFPMRGDKPTVGYSCRILDYKGRALHLVITVDNELCVSFGDADPHKSWYRFGKYSDDHGNYNKPLGEMVDIAILGAKDKIDKLDEVYKNICEACAAREDEQK